MIATKFTPLKSIYSHKLGIITKNCKPFVNSTDKNYGKVYNYHILPISLKTFCNLFDRLLKIAEVQKHTALFAACLQFIAAYLYFHNPVVTVDICTLAVVSVKKVRAVKTSRSFQIIHISPFAQKNTAATKRLHPKRLFPSDALVLFTDRMAQTNCLLIGYIIPRRNAYVNSTEGFVRRAFSKGRQKARAYAAGKLNTVIFYRKIYLLCRIWLSGTERPP